MAKYISILKRSDFTDLYKYGHLYVHNAINFEGTEDEQKVAKDVFDSVTKYLNTYEYSTEYVEIHFNHQVFIGNTVEIFIKDVLGVYAFDSDARASLSISLDPRIQLQVSCWAGEYKNLNKKQHIRQAKAGMYNCFEIFGVSENHRKRFTENLPKYFAEDLFDDLYANKRPCGEKSIWNYLVRYERHSPYWNDERGYFFDAVHAYENFLNKKEYDYEIAEEVPIGDVICNCPKDFIQTYKRILASSEVSKYSVDSFDYILVAALYLYMKAIFKDGGITVNKIRSNEIFSIRVLQQQFENEFSFSVGLLGISLGQELTYSCYYEFKNLGIFNLSHKEGKTNGANDLLRDSKTGKELSKEEAQILINKLYAEIDCQKALLEAKKDSPTQDVQESVEPISTGAPISEENCDTNGVKDEAIGKK